MTASIRKSAILTRGVLMGAALCLALPACGTPPPAPARAPFAVAVTPLDPAELDAAEQAVDEESLGCAGTSGPSGTVTARVTIAPDGHATDTVLEPSPLSGTSSGACVLRAVHDMRVRPFRGAPVSRTFAVTVSAPPPPAPPAPKPMPGDPPRGRISPEEIQRVVRASFGLLRRCYEEGLWRDFTLEGRIAVRYVIALDGSVRNVGDAGFTLPDVRARVCMREVFKKLSYSQPVGGGRDGHVSNPVLAGREQVSKPPVWSGTDLPLLA